MIILVLFGRDLPNELRQNALIGIAGLFIVMQAIFLYANRGMVSVLTAAQRQYLGEDFTGAQHTLEAALEKAPRPDFRALTLLGNTYRQLGMADESHQALTKAVQVAPQHHFPWYGFGRTLMILGRYTEALEAFERALSLGAPLVITIDYAEALYRSGGDTETVLAVLAKAPQPDEAYRELWAIYIHWRITGQDAPDRALIDDGIVYWQAIADRFSHTPYGRAVSDDLLILQEVS
jgi:tetratricopeptide (TPR) repeat protein